jgi:Flp pilus assembly protein TadD
MSVSLSRRLARDRVIREAEGYLELMLACADRWELEPAVRDRIGHRALKTLARLEPGERQRAHVLYLQGLAYRSMECYDEAVMPLQVAAAMQPNNVHIRLTLGWCYKRMGQLPLAIEALKEALAAEPREAIIHYNLACYCSLSGDLELALTHLEIAFDLDAEYRRLAEHERDFDPIRRHPSFLELTGVVC